MFPILLIAFYIILMLASMTAVHEKRLKLLAEQGAAQSDTAAMLFHANDANSLITDYKQRSVEVTRFEEQLKSQRGLTMKLKWFTFQNSLLIPWITICAIGCTMMAGPTLVPQVIGTGIFAVTINALKDLGDRFSNLQNSLEGMFEVIAALVSLTIQFNLPTDLHFRREVQQKREAFVSEYVETNGQMPESMKGYDDIPIAFKNVTYEYSPTLSAGKGINVQASQGSVILVTGPHDSGKSTLLSLLSDTINPLSGDILCPLHLRVIQVSYIPMLVKSRSLYGNLTFGTMEYERPDPERVKRIITRLGLNSSWLQKELDKDLANVSLQESRKNTQKTGHDFFFGGHEEGVNEDKGYIEDITDESTWFDRPSNSEKKRLHIARAFIYNPEVMVLHRPIDELDENLAKQMLIMMREFVDLRGVEMDPATTSMRRPRTLLFTGGIAKSRLNIADYVWTLGHDPGITVAPGRSFLITC
mmetsp:Transcript_29229/g.63865  ORF Transcript_29229/g.63865 Transcript_29229/m.63865 type:complete len:473 (+) Transcript_29229:1-1419(+)